MQKLTDRKVHVVAVVVEAVEVVVVRADLEDIRFLTPFHLVPCNYLTGSAHTREQQQGFGPLQLWLHWLQQWMIVPDLAEDAVGK